MGVSFGEIFKKGGKYFLYYLVFAIIGGIVIGAGGAVMGAEFATAAADPMAAEGVGGGALVGGVILMIIGYIIMAIGMFGVVYKLVVEAVWRSEEGEERAL